MMTTFPFYFGCTLGEFVLKHTDNLSRILQDSSVSAAQGQRLAEDVCKTLSKDRNEAAFDLFDIAYVNDYFQSLRGNAS